MTDKNETEWEGKSELYHFVALCGAYALILGLAAELVLLLELVELTKRQEKLSVIFANILITGGVWIEVHFARVAGRYDDRVKAAIRTRGYEAAQKAAEAQQRADEAALAFQRERVERLKLEAKFAPRSLSPDAALKLRMAMTVASFGTPLDVLAVGEGPETASLMGQIQSALFMGGIAVRSARWTPGPSITGIAVCVKDPGREDDVGLAKSLVAILVEDGLSAAIRDWGIAPWESFMGMTDHNWDAKSMAPVRMLIGPKPLPAADP